jgi:hypothetical protein
MCPNCRATADLEAEVEDPEDWGQQLEDDPPTTSQQQPQAPAPTDSNPGVPDRPERHSSITVSRNASQPQPQQQPSNVPDVTMLNGPSSPNHPGAAATTSDHSLNHTVSNPVPIPSHPASSSSAAAGGAAASAAAHQRADGGRARTPSPTGGPNALIMSGMGHEGPITPRNDAGPWVFDGSGIRLSSEGPRPSQGGDGGGGFS